MATLKGEAVDRPPVSFYELNGLDENPADPDPFNIYSHPSWYPLIQLSKDKTDRIVMRDVPATGGFADPLAELSQTETFYQNGSLITVVSIDIDGHRFSCRSRRDPDVNTVWMEEHLIKNIEDLTMYLKMPPIEPISPGSLEIDVSGVLEVEARLADTGIVMIDTADPLCQAASLFSMENFTIVALTEPLLFHRLLDRFAVYLYAKTEAVARALPGRLWRIYGPEYASTPYLPPRLFEEYVLRYDKPMVESIHRYGGFARIHSHGRLLDILDLIVSTGCMGLDPIEPPPQGDVELRYVRQKYGRDLVLFGNLEVTDIENLPTILFAEKVKRALAEGTMGDGRGFVLMPSSCPYGKTLPALTVNNYEKMVEVVESFGG
jgi:hypothetical protein